jgi:DNA-binding transcriptional LysR family regulator
MYTLTDGVSEMNWDDIRIFLGVAKAGSVRNAANILKVNHSTVSRRISAFEENLGVRLFERMPTGYLLTSAGEDLLKTASKIEQEVNNVDRQIMGKDDRMSGPIRITFPPTFADLIIAETLYSFSIEFPDISFELNGNYNKLDLNKREADLAIRVTNNPPENLIGRKLLSVYGANYVSKELWNTIKHNPKSSLASWIIYGQSMSHPEHIKKSSFPDAPIKHTINFPEGILSAISAGMGIAQLPCIIADKVPDIMRLPEESAVYYSDLWVLTHKDLRHTLKVKTIMDHMAKSLLKHKDLFEGRVPYS